MWLLPKLKKKYKALFFMKTNVDNVGSRLTFFLSVVGIIFFLVLSVVNLIFFAFVASRLGRQLSLKYKLTLSLRFSTLW